VISEAAERPVRARRGPVELVGPDVDQEVTHLVESACEGHERR